MIDDISDIIRDCARKIILPRFRNLKDGEIDTKTGPMDLVTIADVEAEYYLQERIPKVVANAVVAGEESVSRGEFDLDALSSYQDQPIFIVDPIDGTNNFVKGSDIFCVMVAMLEHGVCTKAWIYNVITDQMTSATLGEGAYMDDTPIYVSAEKAVVSEISGYASLRHLDSVTKAQFIAQRDNLIMLNSLSCAGHEYLNVAHGLQDYTILSRLKPWDHLPGVLICQEAGGYAAKWDGTMYKVEDAKGGIITAQSETTWHNLHNMLISP
jgi:fructose-1,6-bisphosphatase/inositol monophosphatase family enzyme